METYAHCKWKPIEKPSIRHSFCVCLSIQIRNSYHILFHGDAHWLGFPFQNGYFVALGQQNQVCNKYANPLIRTSECLIPPKGRERWEIWERELSQMRNFETPSRGAIKRVPQLKFRANAWYWTKWCNSLTIVSTFR
jgi:hypothetical protein